MNTLRSNIVNTYGQRGEEWLLLLPELIQKYLFDWQLLPDGQFENLSFNYALPVLRVDKSKAILKMGPHIKGRVKEAEALKFFDGQGAVKVLEINSLDGVLLLEKVEPGCQLSDLLIQAEIEDVDATKAFGQLLLRLQSREYNFQAMSLTPVQTWGLGFEKFLREDCRGKEFSRELIQLADGIYKDLVASSTQIKVLHGDLHHANILQSEHESWLAIDPKGLTGDPCFEVGAFMRNPMPELLQQKDLDTILRHRFKTLHSITGFDLQRMWGWSFSQCVLAAIWTVEDQSNDYQNWLKLAEHFLQIRNSLN
jgi:streptomycin 6-kinase